MITDALLSELLEAWDKAIVWDDKRLGKAITTLRTELAAKSKKEKANETIPPRTTGNDSIMLTGSQ